MIIKKSILQEYMYVMFWLFYGTVLLAPFEEMVASKMDDETFKSKNAKERNEILKKRSDEYYNKERSAYMDRVSMLNKQRETMSTDPIYRNLEENSLDEMHQLNEGHELYVERWLQRNRELYKMHDDLLKIEKFQQDIEKFTKTKSFKNMTQNLSEVGIPKDVLDAIKITDFENADIAELKSSLDSLSSDFKKLDSKKLENLSRTDKQTLSDFGEKYLDLVKVHQELLTEKLSPEKQKNLKNLMDSLKQKPLDLLIDMEKDISSKITSSEKFKTMKKLIKYAMVAATILAIVGLLLWLVIATKGNTLAIGALVSAIMIILMIAHIRENAGGSFAEED